MSINYQLYVGLRLSSIFMIKRFLTFTSLAIASRASLSQSRVATNFLSTHKIFNEPSDNFSTSFPPPPLTEISLPVERSKFFHYIKNLFSSLWNKFVLRLSGSGQLMNSRNEFRNNKVSPTSFVWWQSDIRRGNHFMITGGARLLNEL